MLKVDSLVRITWRDSHYVNGWHTDDPKSEPLTCLSVGWVQSTNDEAITIAPHVTVEETPQRLGELTIPVSSISHTHTLEGPTTCLT